jgi:twitching motility protein PilT
MPPRLKVGKFVDLYRLLDTIGLFRGSIRMDVKKLLQFAVENGASDLHLQAGAAPMFRISGQPRFAEGKPITAEDTTEAILTLVPDQTRASLPDAAARGLDFSYAIEGLSRFRCSAYSHLGTPAIVIRVIRTNIPSIEELHLPDVIRDIALSERGLTLLTGTTGSGKSTTLAAMVDLINNSLRNKIITIEDPVEYVHTNKKSVIAQLEVGSDTPSFDQALRQALRQDPDVILVGELRDVETLRIALRAADTGHQVFSTVHSSTAAQTIERIIAMFPPAEHKLLLSQLAGSVEAIISQRLVPTRDGKRRPALEILRGSSVTQKFIMEGRLAELNDYIATGESGMQTFDAHLLRMYRENVISGTEALRQATNPGALSMGMRGISGVSTARA